MTDIIDFSIPWGNHQIPLRLYADCALFWPAGQTLILTDPHFGKADSFRHLGIPIPTKVHDNDLERLTKLVMASKATSLIVLGDFFHTRHSQSGNTLAALENWRNHNPDLEIVLVLGNHDAHAGPPPSNLNIRAVDAPFVAGPFVCHHLPQQQPSQLGYILAGHLHPYVVLRDSDGSRLRLASFVFGPHQAILPAFGGFTGGMAYSPSPDERVFVTAQGKLVEVPTTRQRSSSIQRK